MDSWRWSFLLTSVLADILRSKLTNTTHLANHFHGGAEGGNLPYILIRFRVEELPILPDTHIWWEFTHVHIILSFIFQPVTSGCYIFIATWPEAIIVSEI